MKNYKINIDKPKPTQEEILAGRNFDQLLSQYNAAPGKVIKKPFWQSAGFLGSVAAVAATVAIVVMVMKGNSNAVTDGGQGPVIVDNSNNNTQPDHNGNTTAWSPTKRSVAPPLPGVNVPFAEYKVSAKNGGTISYPTGSKVTFQPNSFVDKNGTPVSGNVEVQYREMHDAVDFFLTGVPLEYDSAGKTYQFESAGMLEVAAFINGEVVYLDKNKPMQVEMASAQTGTGFNLYQFDTEIGNWVYQGRDVVKELPKKDDQKLRDSVMAVLLAERQVLVNCISNHMSPPHDAMKPVKANATKNRFVVDFNKQEFPEIAAYQNVIFEVDESKEKFDAANYNITWEDVNLSRGEQASTYKLTLKKGLKQVKLDVYPVLDGEEYRTAQAKYEKEHAKYLTDSAAYVKWVADRAAFGTDGSGVPMPKFDPAMVRSTDQSAGSLGLAAAVSRAFSLSSFGIFNMDSPEMLPEGAVLNMALHGPDGQLFTGYNAVYHVDRQKNTLMNYHNMNPVPEFHCNTRSQNLVWAVKDGELYYAENESFAQLPATGNVMIQLKKVAKKLTTADEMRAFFGLKSPGA
jgi:hypothetical protein